VPFGFDIIHTSTWELLWGCHMGLKIPSVMGKILYLNRSLDGKEVLSRCLEITVSCLGSHYLSMCIFFPSIGVLCDAFSVKILTSHTLSISYCLTVSKHACKLILSTMEKIT
jgi:hypothetical protein